MVQRDLNNQWSDHIWNMQIPCGARINKMISKSLKISKSATKL